LVQKKIIMNNTSIANTAKKVLAVVLFSATVLVVAPSFAKTNKHISTNNTTAQASVKFAGSTDNALFFDVTLANQNADNFTITITTKDGDVLFTKDFSDKNFAKKFKLVKSDDISSYNFKITSSNKSLEQSFSVNASIATIDNVVVTKL